MDILMPSLKSISHLIHLMGLACPYMTALRVPCSCGDKLVSRRHQNHQSCCFLLAHHINGGHTASSGCSKYKYRYKCARMRVSVRVHVCVIHWVLHKSKRVPTTLDVTTSGGDVIRSRTHCCKRSS